MRPPAGEAKAGNNLMGFPTDTGDRSFFDRHGESRPVQGLMKGTMKGTEILFGPKPGAGERVEPRPESLVARH